MGLKNVLAKAVTAVKEAFSGGSDSSSSSSNSGSSGASSGLGSSSGASASSSGGGKKTISGGYSKSSGSSGSSSSGGSSSSSSSSGGNKTASVGKSYDGGGTVSTSYGGDGIWGDSTSYDYSDPGISVNRGVHGGSSGTFYNPLTGETTRPHSYDPADVAIEQAKGAAESDYRKANDRYNQIEANLGNVTDPWQEEAARRELEAARQKRDQAQQALNQFNPPASKSFRSEANNERNPLLAYDPADWQAEQAYGARNSKTDYMTGAERAAASAPNPNRPYEKDYQYATPDELRDMDQNDEWNPFFTPNNGETAYFKGNQETPADPYVAELQKAQEEAYYNPVKVSPLDELRTSAKNFFNGANNFVKSLNEESTPELAQARTAMEEAANAMYAAQTPEDEARYRADYEVQKANYDKLKTEEISKQKEAVAAADDGSIEKNEQLEAIYNGMPKWKQAIRRLELAAEGGLQLGALATFITTPLTKATSILKKAAGDVPTALDLDLPHRYVYSIANGFANPVRHGVLSTELTPQQWAELDPNAKRTLAELYKIDTLDEFNQALKETNALVGSNEYYKEGMDNIRDDILFDEQIKKFHDYSQQMVSEAGYGLPKFWKNVINLVPSEVNMVVQAMFSNWSGWKHAGLMLMGDQVYGETYLDDRYAGYDHEHSANHAFASMVNEVGWELVDGGGVLNQLAYGNKGLFTSGVDAAIAKLDSATMQFILKHASGTLGEVIEEEGTQAFEPFVESLLEEGDYWQTVKEKYGEQRAEDYLWAALGAVIMTEGSNIATDVTTSAVNRFNEGKTDKKTGQPKYVAPNIDGTSTAENPNGKKAYSATMQQIAALNQEKVVGNNPLAKAAYEQAREAGASDSAAFRAAEAVHEATSGLTPEEKKTYASDHDKFNADIDAFQEHGDEFRNAEVGDVILDIDNNEVGVVTKADDKGITVELTNADGEKTTEEVKFVGNNGLLDAESDLAKALGKDGEGAIVNAEEAKIFAQEAAAKRKAQEEAKAAAANAPKATTDSGTGTVAKPQQPQQPTKKAPTPGKPASMESTDSGTGTVQKENAEQPASETQDTKTGNSFTDFITNETPEANSKFEGTFSNTDYRVRYVGNEREGDSSTRQYTISVKGKDGKYHTVGENGQPTRFYADEVANAVSKAIGDSNKVTKTPGRNDIGTAKENYKDFNATISIAQNDLAGSMDTEADYHGQTITVEHQLGGGYSSHLENGISFGGKTVEESLGQALEYLYTHETDEEWNKHEDQKRGEAAQPETNPIESGKEGAQALADITTPEAPTGTLSKAEQYFADNPKKSAYTTTYKESTVKLKKNADGTYTVSMSKPRANGKGWTKSVDVVGTVSSIDEANKLVADEYLKKTAPKALTDAATGKKPSTSETAPESPVSASPETGEIIPTQAQESSDTANETLNTGSEDSRAKAREDYIKAYLDAGLGDQKDAERMADSFIRNIEAKIKNGVYAFSRFFSGEDLTESQVMPIAKVVNEYLKTLGYQLDVDNVEVHKTGNEENMMPGWVFKIVPYKNKGSNIKAKEDLGESSKTQNRETVPAETLEKALYGAADVGAARYEGTLNAKQVAKLSATQVIQRLQNYARKAGTSIKGLLKYITTDETGEPLVSNQSHTKQLIDSAVSGTIGQNVNGEFEDEVDVVGGEDDTRKERKKQSVEEAQEEANEIIRSNLELIGDSIRDATKADRSKYPAGLDGICDWILDSGRKRGIMPTKAEYDAFRQLVKNLLNDEFHRQNHWAKDKNGNVKDINWKKFTAVDALKLIDNMLADKANLENLSDEDFTEINALLNRADNIDVGFGDKRQSSSLGYTYTGRVSLADILSGDERYRDQLPDSEIYDETNLTAGEKWINRRYNEETGEWEDIPETKVSDEEGWRENSKEEDRQFGWYDRSDALEGMTQQEREEYEDAYWVKYGARDVANMFAQKSNTGTGNGAIVTILPTEVNGKTNPRLTGTEKSRKSISTYLSNGRSYIIQVGNNMFRHIIDSDISPRIKSVIDKHKQNVKTLQERIANGEAQKSQLSPALGDRIKKWDAKIAKLQEQLSIEQAWLEKLTKGWDKGKGENETYTLNDFLSDETKDAFGKNLISQEEKDSIGVKTFINPKTGFSDVVYGGFKFDALSKAKSRDFAKEIIDGIKRGVENGELAEHGYFGSRETDSLANRSGVTISESGNYTNSGYYGEQSPADARAEKEQQEKQRLQNQGRHPGIGNVVDEYGTVQQVSGTTGSKQGRRPLKGTQISHAAQEATTSINDFSEPTQLTIRPKGSKPGATISAKWLGGNIYLDGEATGEINPESYRDNNNPDSERLVRVAGAIRDAAAEAGLAIVQINGQIYSTHTDENEEQFTNRTSAIAELSEGYIAISQITDESAGELILDTIHEIMHEHTTNQFGLDPNALLGFIDELSNKSGVNIKAKAQKVIAAYSEDGTTFDANCADEMISRIAEGHDCNGNFTAEEVEKLQDALFGSTMLELVADDAPATVALLNYSRTQVRNKTMPANPFVNKPATDVGYTPSTEAQEGRISGIVHGEDVFSTKESKQSIGLYNFKAGLGNNQTEKANPERLYRPTEQEALATKKNPLLKKKEDLDAWTDETFDALIEEENANESAILNGFGTPIDQQDIDSLVDEASADEINLLNSRGGNVSAEDTGRFNNLVDQASASEEETLNDLRDEFGNDIDTDSEGYLDAMVDEENRSVENILNDFAENAENNYPENRFNGAKEYYGTAYDEVVSKVATRHARANSRSSFTHEDIYGKLYGKSYDAERNFRRLQKLNSNIDSLLKGKMSAYAFNAFAKNMAGEQGIGQILNDDIQREFTDLAKLEEKATGKDRHNSDVINFQYAAADAVAHLCARMDMVEKTERARAKLDALAKEHGKTNKRAIGNALDWYNRMQISGDNFWRMAGNWDAESRNQGYALAQEHNKAIATRISEEAKLKDYFSGIDKNSKEFRDFANGTTMSNVDFEGHKISLMEAVKFVKICDTMRSFAKDNKRPEWQRVASLGGFAFRGADGKTFFVDIQGSKKNNSAERIEWVQEKYDQLKAEIEANSSASAYMKAAEEMYFDGGQDAAKVYSRVNGYDRYMYGKGRYTDIHYANKNGTTDFSYKDRDATDVHDTGIMQRRSRVNGGYVMVNPMSQSVDAYISQISNYIAFEEFGQKLGVLSDSKSINGSYANTIRDSHGDQFSKWFDNYVKTMTLYHENDPKKLADVALQKARQAMMTGALSLSVSVPIKQVSSFFDTMGMLDPRAVKRAFMANPSGKKVKGINNYLYQSRGQTISDPDLAELFSDTGLLGKFKRTKAGKVVMKATNMMDEKAVSNVYMACVYDTELNTLSADRLYKNRKNFKDGLTAEGQFYVDSKFEQVLLGTQPIFTPQARNELARTDNQLLRMFQTFRTQQTQNYNRALQALNEWNATKKYGGDSKAAFKTVRQTVQGQLTASVSLAALNAIATTLLHKHHKYKDDDDEFDKKKFWKRFGLDALESFMGNALWVGDLTKWAIDKADISDSREFYGVASGALGTAWTIGTSAVDLYRNIQEDGWTQSNKVSARYLASNVATAMGKPLNNAYAIINAGWQWYADLAGIERKYDDIFLQWAYVTDTPQNRLVSAILKGDQNKVDDMYAEMGQDDFSNAVYYGALEKYKEGKIDETEYVELLMNFASKSFKEANNEVQKKKALIDSGISQYNGIDGRDGRAAFYDQYSSNFKSREAYKKFFSDVKAGKEDGKHNTYHTTYKGKQSEVTANQSSIIDRMNENIKAGNFDYNTAKLLWENYYGYSSSKRSAWQFVGK